MKEERSFWYYYRMTATQPRLTFGSLIGDPLALRYTTTAVAITALVYTFVYLFLILGGGQPFKPWLDIPLESYYQYNVFFCAPSMFLGWILAAGVVHVISRAMGTTGTFESVLCVFGFGISIASWATGLHDVLTSFLGAMHIIDQRNYEIALNSPTLWRTLLWIQMMIYLAAFILLFSKGVKVVYSMKTWPSVLLGTLGFVVYQLFFLIFNR